LQFLENLSSRAWRELPGEYRVGPRPLYRLIRAALATCKTFLDDLRALTRYMLFPNWGALMDLMMRGLKIGPYAKPP
jgi:hypothetical protein